MLGGLTKTLKILKIFNEASAEDPQNLYLYHKMM